MKSQVVVVFVMALTTTVTTGAQERTAPWGGEFPIAEATKTELSVGKYLWGSTLILAAPGKFQGYWPDYGYRWSNVADSKNWCSALGKRDAVKNSNLGRVRLVAEAGENEERLIGVELRSDDSGPSTEKENFTPQSLCALLSDGATRQRVDSMVDEWLSAESAQNPPKVWLVTENTIPVWSLKPEIRVGE